MRRGLSAPAERAYRPSPCPAATSRTRVRGGTESRRACGALSPDVLVLAGFMRILPPELCREYKGRVLNIHPSLLPRFPGLNTYRRVLAAGDRWHGTTVHFVTEDLDAGPRVAQARIRVGRGDGEDTLRARVQACEHVLYPRVLEWMSQGRLDDGRPARDTGRKRIDRTRGV